MKLPVDVRALYDTSKQLKEDRERPVRLAVLVEIDAPDLLVEAAREELRPRTRQGIVDVSVIEPGQVLRVDAKADAAIVLVGSGSNVTPTLRDLRDRAIPAAVVAVREDAHALAHLLDHPENDVLVGLDARELIRGDLAAWAMTRLEKLSTALGHNFEFMRRAAAKNIVRKAAWQNAAIGVFLFLPGADMPLMTMNQGRMLLQIAAAYGQALDTDRVKELAAVVAGGFLFRTFARELVGLVPGLGWAVKGGIAYSGTIAMGNAAISYFEEGADLPSVVKALTERAGEAAARVAGARRGARAQVGAGYVETVPVERPAHRVEPAGTQSSLLEVEAPAPSLGIIEDAPKPGSWPGVRE